MNALLRGLEVRVVHDLFQPSRRVTGGDLPGLCPSCGLSGETERVFDPYLTQLNVSFSIGERTLAALLGRGIAGQQGIVPEVQPFEDLEEEAQLRNQVESERVDAAESGRRTPWSLNVFKPSNSIISAISSSPFGVSGYSHSVLKCTPSGKAGGALSFLNVVSSSLLLEYDIISPASLRVNVLT